MDKLKVFRDKASVGYDRMYDIWNIHKNGGKFMARPSEVGDLVISIGRVIVFTQIVKQHFSQVDGDRYEMENDYLKFADCAKKCHEVVQSGIPVRIIADLCHGKYPGDPETAHKFFKICQDIVMDEFRDAIRESKVFTLG